MLFILCVSFFFYQIHCGYQVTYLHVNLENLLVLFIKKYKYLPVWKMDSGFKIWQFVSELSLVTLTIICFQVFFLLS